MTASDSQQSDANCCKERVLRQDTKTHHHGASSNMKKHFTANAADENEIGYQQKRRSSVSTITFEPSSLARPATDTQRSRRRASSSHRRSSSSGVPSEIISQTSSMAQAAAIVAAMNLEDDLSDDEDSMFGFDIEPCKDNTKAPPRAAERRRRACGAGLEVGQDLVISEYSDEDNSDNSHREEATDLQKKQERLETERRKSLDASGELSYHSSYQSFAVHQTSRCDEHRLKDIDASKAWNARQSNVYRRGSQGSSGAFSYGELSLLSTDSSLNPSMRAMSEDASTQENASIKKSHRGIGSSDRKDTAGISTKPSSSTTTPKPFRRTSDGSLGVMTYTELSLGSEETDTSTCTSSRIQGHRITARSTATQEAPSAQCDIARSQEQTMPLKGYNSVRRRFGNPGGKNIFRRTSQGSEGVMSLGELSILTNDSIMSRISLREG